MQKIIVAFDGLKYSESAAYYAIEIAKNHRATIVGVFLEDFTYHSFRILDLVAEEGGKDEARAEYLKKTDEEMRDFSVKHFAKSCLDSGLNCKIHRDRNIAIQELLHESRYADMLIIQNNETLTHYSEDTPTHFISELLERIECPVMLVPDFYVNTEKIIFLYDGEPSSIFAMKQFYHLFHDQKLPVDIISSRPGKELKVVPDSHLLNEWLRAHFSTVHFTILQGNAKKEILQHLHEEIKNPLVVLGAYERGMLSRWFNKSMADVIISHLNVPVFIAHK